MTKPQLPSRIPEFTNRQEEAEFWDMHDVTDFLDELQPVQAKFSKSLSEGVTVRFDTDTLDQLRSVSSEKGIGPTTLIRMWVLERLKEIRNQPRTRP